MDISEWRRRIDEVDAQLVSILNERAQCAVEIGRLKQVSNADVYDPEREAKVLGAVVARNGGPLSDEAICRLFKSIIDESRSIEHQRMESDE